jgi:peptide/nickel transport system ATP-binding protein
MELFGIAKGKQATERVLGLMEQVALGSGMLHYQASRLSGGERQRVAIARALALDPDVIVCDEPVSALDVLVQSQVLTLLDDLQERLGLSYLFISHDLKVVRALCHRVIVMQNGRIVEQGPVADVLVNPKSDYTRRLVRAAFEIAV